MQPTITGQEANHRVEDYVTKAREALPAEARYELFSSEERGDCSDPTDNGPRNRIIATRTYQVHDLPKENIPSYFDALRTWWLNHNFRVLDNNPPNEYLWVENNADSFRMALEASPKGNLFLTATSPCVWPNGTPEAEALGADEPGGGTAFAQDPPAVPSASTEAKPPQARKPRRPRPPDDDEDFSEIDWTSE